MQTGPLPSQSLAQLIEERIRWRRRVIVQDCLGIALFGAALAFIAGARWQFDASLAIVVVSLSVLIVVLIGAFDSERKAVQQARAEVRNLTDERAFDQRWRQMYAEFQQSRSVRSTAFLRAIELERPGIGVPAVVMPPIVHDDQPGT